MDEKLLEADQEDGAYENPLSCDQYPSTFPELESSLETHKDERPYVCNQCGRSYRHAGSLVNHKKTHQVGLFACLICQKEYSNPMGLKNHLRIHSEEKRFTCDDCGESFRMSRQLFNHRRTSHGLYSTSNEEGIPSSHESLDAAASVLVENSTLLSNLENYIAESMVPGDFSQLATKYYPDVKSPADDSVNQETERLDAAPEEKEQMADSNYEERRYKCNQCGKAYKHAGSLANHRQTHTVGVYQCAVCYKEFSNLMAMKNHCRHHSESRSHRRSKLSHSYMQQNHPVDNAGLSQHTESRSRDLIEKTEDQQKMSEVSENSTSEEEAPKMSFQSSQDVEPVPLNSSAKTDTAMNFDPLLQTLSRDNTVHEVHITDIDAGFSVDNHEAGQMSFSQSGSEIADEEESKSGENLENRPFMCQECGRTYRHAGSLINHKKTHQTGVYSCSICSKQMFNMAALKNHLRAHFKSRGGRKMEDTYFPSNSFSSEPFQSPEEPYQCSICSEVLTCENDFLQHQALHQVEDMVETNNIQQTEEAVGSDSCCENPVSSQGSSEDSAYFSGPGIPDAIKREVDNLAIQQPQPQWNKNRSPEILNENTKKEGPDLSLQSSLPRLEQSPNDPIVLKEADSSEIEEQGVSQEDRPYKCDACGRDYRHKSSLLNHKLTHQTGVYQCSICPKQYSNLMALRNHIRFHARSHTGRRGNISRQSRQMLFSEQRTMHIKSDSPYETSIELNPNDDSYLNHGHEADSKEEALEEPHICSCCGDFFDSVESLQTHRESCSHNITAPISEEYATDLNEDNSMQIEYEDNVCRTAETENGRDNQGKRLYECDLCDKSYRHSGSLINHKRTHQTGDYICSVCSKHVHNLAALKNHLRIHHKVKKGNREQYDSSGVLYPDVSFSQDNRGLFGCSSCEEMFQSEDELVTHQEVHMGQDEGSWEQQMEDVNEIDNDVLGFNNQPAADLEQNKSVFGAVCNDWDPSCSLEQNFQMRQNEMVENETIEYSDVQACSYTCGECGDVFSSTESLSNHKQTHQIGIYQCSFCPKEYPNLSALRNHFQSHTKSQAIRSNNRENLDASEDIEHTDAHSSEDNSYDCGHCGMLFSNEADFHQHQVAHENHVMHETSPGLHSDGCASEFPFSMHSSEQELLNRIKTEIEEGGDPNDSGYGGSQLSHICGFCGKTYDDLESLKTHNLSHCDEVPSCDETQVTEEKAEKEIKEITRAKDAIDSTEPSKNAGSPENRPYTCDQCGKTYRHGGSLVNHKKTHLVGNFQCFVCSRQYPNMAAYRNHLRHHPTCKRGALHNIQEFATPNLLDSTYSGGNGELLNHPITAVVPLPDPYSSQNISSDSNPCIEPVTKDINIHLDDHSPSKVNMQTQTNHIKPLRRSSKKENHTLDDVIQSTSLSDSQNILSSDDKSFQICEFCGKLFFDVNELIIHLSSNCGSKPTNIRNNLGEDSVLSEEGESPLVGQLQTKQRTETGFHQRPFRCEVCGRSYRHAGSLINHKQSHKTGVFRCSICQKRFFNLMAMKNHNRIHFELKRHKCFDCGKAFRLRKQLDTHQRIHKQRAATKKGRRNRKGIKIRKISVVKQEQKSSLNFPRKNLSSISLRQRVCETEPMNLPAAVPSSIKQDLNPDSRPYQCNQCGRSYRHAGSLVNHKKSHTTGQYFCSICDKTYPNLMAMKNHQRTHYEAKRHICPECGKAFKWQRQLIRHKLVHAQQIAKLNSQSLAKDVQTIEESSSQEGSSEPPHKKNRSANEASSLDPSSPLKPVCQECGVLFVSYDELENHVCRETHGASQIIGHNQSKDDGTTEPDQVHQSEVRPYKCNVCNRTYRHAGSLLNHKNTHKTGVYKCSLCHKQFFNPLAMKNHLRNHTAKKRFQCLVCGKAFRSSRELICHHRVHTGERPFHCPVCNRRFSSKLTLRQHQRTHKDLSAHVPSRLISLVHKKDESTKNSEDDPSLSSEDMPNQNITNSQEERRFKCNQCERSYRHAGSLLNHRKTHSTGVYQCPDCHKEFFNLLALKNHLRIHRYPCQDCGKAFRIASHLATHRKIHEQGGPFTCSVCSKRFFCRSSFERHQLAHRSQDNEGLESPAVGSLMVEVT
ncbi:zinc finger protein 646 [Bombina bombina]|uniref:zinc finger protein 646 n=1 Tax=Bombina bombina TaxID=8345 RepID=UPI00235B1CAA|nr:zinc finger protein 646 [Bombina bombina]